MPAVMTSWPRLDDGEFPIQPHQCMAVSGWHCCRGSGRWDIEAIAREYSAAVQFSECFSRTNALEPLQRTFSGISFSPAEHIWVTVSSRERSYSSLRVWARSQELAEREFIYLRDRYKRKPKRTRRKTNFGVLTIKDGTLGVRQVIMSSAIKGDDDLDSHYGAQFTQWNSTFLMRLAQKKTGITILRGEPGTGKTTYLRYLTYKLRRRFRFYYLPLSIFPLLTAPTAVDFWMGEHEEHKNFGKIVILEDAESLLMERANDNQANVSNLLNMADGFLGEMLQLHVICTINCPLQTIDSAITRPGRLLAIREFARMQPAHAWALAKAKNLQLEPQDDYSLAELYNGGSEEIDRPKSVGFSLPEKAA